MRILLVTETYLPFIAGVSTSSDSIGRFLAKNGHQVIILSPQPLKPQTAAPQDNLTLEYAPSFPDPVFHGKPMTVWPIGIPKIYSLIKKFNPDIIHVQEPGSLGISALILGKIFRKKMVGALHFTPDQIARLIPGNPQKLIIPLMEIIMRLVYRFYDNIMVPTETFVKYLAKLGITTPMTVVSNGVDTNLYHPATKTPDDLKEFNLPNNKVIFFFLSRVDKDKNIRTIIRAMPKTSDKVHLLIAGTGNDEAVLHQMAIDLNVTNKITWVKQLTQEKIIKAYHASDCFVLMSPYEVQSIVTLQAIASGLPVLCSQDGALPELCHDGENGFLIPTYDYKFLAQKINLIAADAKMRIKMGQKSRQTSLPHHKPEVLKRLEKMYINLLTK